MGFCDSDAPAAAPSVVLVHGAFDHLANHRHDGLAARLQAALQGIAEVTMQAMGRT